MPSVPKQKTEKIPTSADQLNRIPQNHPELAPTRTHAIAITPTILLLLPVLQVSLRPAFLADEGVFLLSHQAILEQEMQANTRRVIDREKETLIPPLDDCENFMGQAFHAGLRFAINCWPGWREAWQHGSFRGMLIAWTFSMLLCLAWLATFLWPALMGTWEGRFLWGVILCAAMATLLLRVARSLSRTNKAIRGCPPQDFLKAQENYLLENYFEAETSLAPFSKPNEVSDEDLDIEAALLLATIYRRTHRFDLAIDLVDHLLRLERAERWHDELLQERKIAIERKIRSRTESS